MGNQPSVPRIADVLGRKDAEDRRATNEWNRDRDRLWNSQCAQYRAKVAAEEQGRSLSEKKRRGLQCMLENAAKQTWRNRVSKSRSF